MTACVHGCHQIDCELDDCPGCRLAAPQSLVCHRCDRLTRQHQRDLPGLYDDLTGAYAVRSGHALTGIEEKIGMIEKRHMAVGKAGVGKFEVGHRSQ